MICHLARQLFALALLIYSSQVLAGAGINTNLTTTSASNVLQTTTGSGISFFYSNINSTPDGNGYFQPGSAIGAGCTPALNPRCTSSTQPFWFQASDSVAISGAAQFYVVYATTPPTASGQSISSLGPVIMQFADNGPGNVSQSPGVSWGTICSALTTAGITGIDANCTQTAGVYSAVTVPLYLIADANGSATFDSGESSLAFSLVFQSFIPSTASITNQVGFYGFETFPGDGEVHLRDPGGDTSATSGGNATSQIGTQYIQFYYVTGSDADSNFTPSTFSNITPQTNANIPYFDLIPDATGNLNSYDITGLTDGTSYYFRSSIVDYAGNIGYITCGGGAQCPDDVPASDDGFPSAHAAKPDQIAGLLSKNGNCFIATVAYGSGLAPQVQILRSFRDKILMKRDWGKRFVRWYYHNGPTWSERIRHHDTMRAIVRQSLYPLIGFSWLALRIGAFNACLLIVTLLLLPLLILKFFKTQNLLEGTH